MRKGWRMDKKKRLVLESGKTKKVREKIRKRWEKEDPLITASALADTVDKIHQWIAANATDRVTLKKKEIRLFDQNQNAATLSRKVQLIALKIQGEHIGFDSPSEIAKI